MKVDFTVDNGTTHTENSYRFCMGGGNPSCAAPGGTPYDTTQLSNGTHTLHVVAHDTTTGLTGEVYIPFVVAN